MVGVLAELARRRGGPQAEAQARSLALQFKRLQAQGENGVDDEWCNELEHTMVALQDLLVESGQSDYNIQKESTEGEDGGRRARAGRRKQKNQQK